MKTQSTQSKPKSALIISVIILLLIVGFIGIYVGVLKKPLFGWPQQYTETTDNIDSQEPTQEEKDTGNQSKSDTIEKGQQPTATDPSSPIQITLTANSLNGDTYQIRYLLEDGINGGVCKLTLTQGSKTVTQEANIQALASSSTCEGFNVSHDSLSPGQWNATLNVESNGRTGTRTDTISIQ
jgi:hypothetical protein